MRCNKLIGRFSTDIQSELYRALESGRRVFGTRNMRGIPGDSFIVNNPYLEVIVDPRGSQLEYVEFELLLLPEIFSFMGFTISELKAYRIKLGDKFLRAMESVLHKINNQYTASDVDSYIQSLGE